MVTQQRGQQARVVAPRTAPGVSKGEINRCGDHLRDWWLSDDEPNDVTLMAWNAIQEFRSSFQYPMTKVAVGVRQFVRRESSEVIVAQRLKRMPQIINKLVRFPDTKLARMEDIGGCRAILPGGRAEILGVMKRIKRNWDVKRERDYIDCPKPTGYRGVHLVVERDGQRIEVQLRTPGQQAWADAVERTAGRLRLPLKDGQGHPELVEYFRLAAEGIAMDEGYLQPDAEFATRFATARAAVQHYFQGR
ncbi:RelA/SpoT domain-containing protein [Micromonospora sp. WMMD1082]|uniref:RelA/SpoT domain-containing protein n=1 Tax=Micromonospora sp. WMMD1082 TaxID=3016104 RepID=UPI002415F0AB|nr:RelA/SpoT domain-containing protein [Micromonospora sp. WMMD1082]MDG4794418.1 RelA/SpoT domain-containing protein [Micromonospora sp. WMMD1082]